MDIDTVCFSCRAREQVEREDRRQHEKDRVSPGQPKYDEGRIYTVREMSPEEVEPNGR